MANTVLITGSSGFIAGYLVEEFLRSGWNVIGVDNGSKYGAVRRSYDNHERYRFVASDAKNADLLKELLVDCDHFVAAAAMIGGIRYFHDYAYDLLAENERITAAALDAAIHGHRAGRLKKITIISSSMVYESVSTYATPEGAELISPPPKTTYGFQKLACEYFVRGAWQQYGLPYTIVRPFNCVGVGDESAVADRAAMKSAMSHVVPDLIQKVLSGQDPLHILGSGRQIRHFTYGGDLARGIRIAVEHPAAHCEDFNMSNEKSTEILELAELIWRKICPDKPFRYVCDEPFANDVQKRVPDCSKARRLLGFEATTSLDTILDEVIPWVVRQMDAGRVEGAVRRHDFRPAEGALAA